MKASNKPRKFHKFKKKKLMKRKLKKMIILIYIKMKKNLKKQNNDGDLSNQEDQNPNLIRILTMFNSWIFFNRG